MKVITLATIKGGVGKTVLASHLAGALASDGKKTLLIDLDPQGHATLLAGVDADPDAPCSGDALLPQGTPLESVIVSVRENLDVSPAVLRMALQERQLYAWALRLRSLAKALESINDQYDAVVVDTPPNIGAFTEAALHAADLTIAPVPALAGAVQGFGDLQSTWIEMQDGREGVLAAVVNLFDKRTSATNTAVMDAISAINVRTFATRIPKAERINQAALAHQLIFDVEPGHPAGGMLKEFAAEAMTIAGGVL